MVRQVHECQAFSSRSASMSVLDSAASLKASPKLRKLSMSFVSRAFVGGLIVLLIVPLIASLVVLLIAPLIVLLTALLAALLLLLLIVLLTTNCAAGR